MKLLEMDSGGGEGPFATPSVMASLEQLCPGGVHANVDLAKISRWKIGGRADCIVRPASIEELSSIVKFLVAEKLPYLVIGATTNLLFADEGLRAIAIQIGCRMARIEVSAERVWCQSGAWVPAFAHKVGRAGLTGGEHVCGIPGTIGGLICMNGGSQRKGIGENLVRLTAVTPAGDIREYSQEACGFAYRTSVFQANNDIIAEADFEFVSTGNYRTIRKEMLSILRNRRKKFPQKSPNCGSVFVSNPAMYDDFGPPGKIIEKLGLKGVQIGGARISTLHANFIINQGSASARDVLNLIMLISEKVLAATGYAMDVEARYVTAGGEVKGIDENFQNVSSS